MELQLNELIGLATPENMPALLGAIHENCEKIARGKAFHLFVGDTPEYIFFNSLESGAVALTMQYKYGQPEAPNYNQAVYILAGDNAPVFKQVFLSAAQGTWQQEYEAGKIQTPPTTENIEAQALLMFFDFIAKSVRASFFYDAKDNLFYFSGTDKVLSLFDANLALDPQNAFKSI